MRHLTLIALALAAMTFIPAVGAAPRGLTPTISPTAAPDPTPPDPDDGCHLMTIQKGDYSGWGFDLPKFRGADLIIRDPDAWLAFWQGHTAGIDPPPPPPPVDFQRRLVIASIQGPQTSGGGPNTAIMHVQRHGPMLRILVFDDQRPGPLDVITNPFHIVAIDRHCLPPRASLGFEHIAPQPDTAVVVGRVLGARPDEPPIPLPGAHVALLALDADGEPFHAGTGLDGSFFFINVAPGPYELAAEIPGFEPAATLLAVPPNTLVAHQFVLEPRPPEPGAIHGLTLHPTETGLLPLPGTHLQLIRDGEPVAETMSNDDGQYGFPEIPPGPYLLHAAHEGFFPRHAEVMVEPGQTVVQNLILEPWPPQEFGQFAGLVLGLTPDGGEIPLARARVCLQAPDGFSRFTFTNQQGAFLMVNVPAGEYFATARAGGWRPTTAEIVVVPDEVTEHVFVLEPPPPSASAP